MPPLRERIYLLFVRSAQVVIQAWWYLCPQDGNRATNPAPGREPWSPWHPWAPLPPPVDCLSPTALVRRSRQIGQDAAGGFGGVMIERVVVLCECVDDGSYLSHPGGRVDYRGLLFLHRRVREDNKKWKAKRLPPRLRLRPAN